MDCLKNVYFIQVGFAFGKAVYLPYAAGCIAAYAFADKEILQEYSLAGFIYRRDDINKIVDSLDSPAVAAFSNYIWNTEFNKQLALKIKERYPRCRIIFGGHVNIAEDAQVYALCCDAVIYGEGEIDFARLLRSLSGGETKEIKGVSYNISGVFTSPSRTAPPSLADLPSPYLSGVFDELINNSGDTEFLAILETNRGCPYSCTYCSWCEGSKVRFFPIDKISSEIRWLSKHKIEYCFCADANFGMFARDVKITEMLVESKRDSGYPDVFRPCYAKESDDRVFEICRMLNEYSMDKGATMAYQTLCTQALRNINRNNFTMEHFSELLAKYNEAGIPTYSELILGLPGETRESFCEGLCALLNAGQHNSVSVYYCELLPGTVMADEAYMKKFGIVGEKIPFNHIHSTEEDSICEYSNIVTSTASMPREDWVEANLFSICLQCFHSLGLLQCFSIYLRYEKNVPYKMFYESLLKNICNGGIPSAKKYFDFAQEALSVPSRGGWYYKNALLGDVSWFFEEGFFVMLLKDAEVFYTEASPFLLSFGIDDELFAQLLSYQRAVIRKPFIESEIIETDYDFCTYFNLIKKERYAPLEKRKSKIRFNYLRSFKSWEEYAKETVWYGRRRGATLLTNNAIETINDWGNPI